MEPEPVLLARIPADGGYVVCGVVSCGAKIANILNPPLYTVFDGIQPDEERKIFFPPAWAPREDGIWAFAGYAMKRRRRGRNLKFRRNPRPAAGLTDDNTKASAMCERLPSRAQCPRCGFINTLSLDALKVSEIMPKR